MVALSRSHRAGWPAFAVALAIITGKCLLMLWLGSRTPHMPEPDEEGH